MAESSHLESFTEFQYFTNITEIPPFAFYNFTKLKRICLPPNIKNIGNKAFYGCTSLEHIESNGLLKDVVKLVL